MTTTSPTRCATGASPTATPPRLRIVLAGYLTEHDQHMPNTWRRLQWSSSAAYSTTASAARSDGNHDNRHLECLWISPGCLNPGPPPQGALW